MKIQPLSRNDTTETQMALPCGRCGQSLHGMGSVRGVLLLGVGNLRVRIRVCNRCISELERLAVEAEASR